MRPLRRGVFVTRYLSSCPVVRRPCLRGRPETGCGGEGVRLTKLCFSSSASDSADLADKLAMRNGRTSLINRKRSLAVSLLMKLKNVTRLSSGRRRRASIHIFFPAALDCSRSCVFAALVSDARDDLIWSSSIFVGNENSEDGPAV